MKILSLVPILAGAAVLVLTVGPTSLEAQNERIGYTAAQAAQGKAAYNESCATCHGADLDDGEFAPPLRGDSFMASWGGKPAGAVFDRLRTMPPANPGSLNAEGYARIFAYVLQQNGVPSSATPLPSRTEALARLIMPSQSASPGAAGIPQPTPGGAKSPGQNP